MWVGGNAKIGVCRAESPLRTFSSQEDKSTTLDKAAIQIFVCAQLTCVVNVRSWVDSQDEARLIRMERT
jgi:hypothetical protein